ncbi:glycosyltransferase family 4 protein [Sphingobacterium sp. BIGb0165]|uniref:glycosyltransferase family 4 protein n=1 Tax=Sphingobacterium sp. BIGb0165 TaxID=2940615 RepID=UPI002169ADF0|nr:glycosyltransferase family 4 protein [Sphingobacterium sp. BIGb0165]MCS4223982.1 glycosyltransferase involved in cell wall biosynthesis [Sphingobacterium sp. BIGb0165]
MLPSEIEILFISHKYPPAVGGMEKQSFELINNAALYLKVHTIVYDNKESILTFFFRLNQRILSKIKDNPGIRLLHFNDGLIAALASFHKGYDHLKKVVTLHGLDIVFPFPYFQHKVIPRFNTFDQVITVSQATAEAAQSRGIDSSRISVIPNGVDPLSSISVQEEDKFPPYFITLGRPVKRKGFSWLMQQVIPALQGNFKLLMVGPFDQRPTLKERLLNLLPAKLYHLSTLFLGHPSDQQEMRRLLKAYPEKIQHLGKVPFVQLKHLLANAQAFLMPNIHVPGDMEGFGLVCLEASSAGTVVVASELEGITSAITHNHNGLLLNSQDTDAWIGQLQSILDNPDHYQNLGQQFKNNTSSDFSWDIMARSYCHTFVELCQKPQPDHKLSSFTNEESVRSNVLLA